jgi:hypothetical protein
MVVLKEPFLGWSNYEGRLKKFVDLLYYSVYVFEEWVEYFKKCIACHGRYFKKETVIAPPQSSDLA